MPRVGGYGIPLGFVLLASLGGCGLYVPEKGIFSNDNVERGALSPQGVYENRIVGHIRCELREGVRKALVFPQVRWLKGWGATVTLNMSVDETGGVTPSASFLPPPSKTLTFTLGIGLSASAHTTRKETITFTLAFDELLREDQTSCDELQNGFLIDSDLKIAQFIYDKAVVASVGEATNKPIAAPPFSVFQEDLTFVSSFGDSVAPTWKLTRVIVDPSSPLFSASRGNTNDVLITLAPVVKKATGNSQAELTQQGRDHHSAGLIGQATGAQVQSQAR